MKDLQIAEENRKIVANLKLKDLPKNPLVSVIIPAHNEEKFVWKAIESLLKQTYKPIEIIVVDNASDDSTADIIKNYEKDGVTLVKNVKNEGFGGGCNAGWKVAKGQLLMFFDADEVYGENYIKDLVKPILEGKDVCTLHNMERIANFDNLWARGFGFRYNTQNGRGKIFTIIRRDVFDKLGPFDPSLGYADDKTLNVKYGLTSYGVDAQISHHNPDSFAVHWKHGKWVGKSNPHPYKVIFVLPVFPLYVLYKTLKHLMKDPYWKLVYFLPYYYTIKYFSYFVGAIERIKGEKKVQD